MLLGPIPEAIVLSASFKFNVYELDLLRKIYSPFALVSLNLEGNATATSLTEHLEYKISSLVAIPKHVSFIFIVSFLQLVYNLNTNLLTSYMSCCPKKYTVR